MGCQQDSDRRLSGTLFFGLALTSLMLMFGSAMGMGGQDLVVL